MSPRIDGGSSTPSAPQGNQMKSGTGKTKKHGHRSASPYPKKQPESSGNNDKRQTRYGFVNGIEWRGLCKICNKSLEERKVPNITTTCGHTFHNNCITDFVKRSMDNHLRTINCPACQKVQNGEDLAHILSFQQSAKTPDSNPGCSNTTPESKPAPQPGSSQHESDSSTATEDIMIGVGMAAIFFGLAGLLDLWSKNQDRNERPSGSHISYAIGRTKLE